MKCTACGSNIDASFKHAISKNECPACGGQIMDEETMALIEDIGNTILGHAAVRKETARDLAMVIAARYDIEFRTDIDRVAPQPRQASKEIPQEEEEIKVAQPSTARQTITTPKTQKEEDIVKISDLVQGGVSDAEREEIMAEVVKQKMNMVESAVMPEEFSPVPEEQSQVQNPEADAMSSALFGSGQGNVLEEERMLRLAKQQQAIQSGSGGFRRGS